MTVSGVISRRNQTSGVLVENYEGTGKNRNLSGAQTRKMLPEKALDEGRPVPVFEKARKQRTREVRREAFANANPTTTPASKVQTVERVVSASLGLIGPGLRLTKRPREKGSYAAITSTFSRVRTTWQRRCQTRSAVRSKKR